MLITDKIIKLAGIVAIAVIISCVVFFIYLKVIAPNNVQKLTPAEIKRPDLVADKLNVSDKVGKEIVKKIETAKPVESYVVPAKEAPEKVKQIIDTKPADKTIVSEDPEKKKIDVYKINLDKPRAIGLYASTESAGLMAQYKNVVVFGGPKYKGGYEIGAAYMVRF